MRLLIMGAPGTGKGTYAEGIEKHFGIPIFPRAKFFAKPLVKKRRLAFLRKVLLMTDIWCRTM